jgi:hypothetical protein
MRYHTWKIPFTFLFLLLIVILLSARPGFGAPVSMDIARLVATNFLNHVHAANTIESIETVPNGARLVAYLVQLSPQGYILVAKDDIRIPVKGYSLTSNFSDLPEPYKQALLQELEIPLAGPLDLPLIQEDETNAPYWEYLSRTPEETAGRGVFLAYTPNTFLLTSQWNQGYPYNKFAPTI